MKTFFLTGILLMGILGPASALEALPGSLTFEKPIVKRAKLPIGSTVTHPLPGPTDQGALCRAPGSLPEADLALRFEQPLTGEPKSRLGGCASGRSGRLHL